MKNASNATKAILAAGQAVIAELLDIQLSSKYGSALYHFTDFDTPLSAAIYPSSTPATYQLGYTIEIGDETDKIGTEGSELEITIAPQWDYANGGQVPLIAGYPFLQACRLRILNGATITRSRMFFAPGSLSTAPGAVKWFVGVVGDIEVGRLKAVLKVGSPLSLMTMQMPRSVYQVGCAHTVYDAGCTLSKAAFRVSGTVGTVSNAAQFNTNLTQPDNFFSKAPGQITFTSGVNNGLTASVKQYLHASGAVALFAPLPAAPSTGDTFTILPACDHQRGTCANNNSALGPTFNNLAHYKGEDFIPVPETMLDGGTSNPPQQTPGSQAGVIIGSAISSSRNPS